MLQGMRLDTVRRSRPWDSSVFRYALGTSLGTHHWGREEKDALCERGEPDVPCSPDKILRWLLEIKAEVVQLLILCNPVVCSTPGFPVHHQLLELAQTPAEWVMPSNHLILCCPLLPSIFPSIRVFSSESAFTSSGQSIGVSASASGLPVNIQGWFPLGLTDFISVLFKGLYPRVKWSDLYVVFC